MKLKCKLKLVAMSVLMIMVMAVMPITTVYASSGSAEQESAWATLEEKYDTWNKCGVLYGNAEINSYPAYLLSELNSSSNTILTLQEKKNVCDRLIKDGYVCVYGKNITATEEECLIFIDMFAHSRDKGICNVTDINGNMKTTNSCEIWFDRATLDIMKANYTALEEEEQIIANGTIPTKLKRDDLARLISRNIVFDEYALSENYDPTNEKWFYEDVGASHTSEDSGNSTSNTGDADGGNVDDNNAFPMGTVIGIGLGLLAIIVILVVLLMRKNNKRV